MIKPIHTLLFSLVATIAAPALAGSPSFVFSPADKEVNFTAIGNPSLLKIHGKGDRLTGTTRVLQAAGGGVQLSGNFEMELESLETGIGKRDEHMKEKYLETEKYPKATLAIQELRIPGARLEDWKGSVPFTGILGIHGITKPVEGTVDLAFQKDKASAQARFKVKLTDYSIAIPSFAGITVADRVDVEVRCSGPLSETKESAR